jgi:integrase
MPLKVIRRPDTGMLTIVGTIKLLDGSSLRVRQRAQSDRRKLADEEAALLEARLLREGWHGPKRGSRPFAAAVASYIAAAPRRPMQLKRIKRAMLALGDVLLSEIDQEALTGAGGAAERMFKRCEPAPQTVLRELITPVRAVMHYARRQRWCDLPDFEQPKRPDAKPIFLLPAQAVRLVNEAAPHLQPLLVFMLCTGARPSEAIELAWPDVDLAGARVTFWKTKNGKRRTIELVPAAVAALRGLAETAPKDEDGNPTGAVFFYQRRAGGRREAYKDRNREYGGQIKTAFGSARERARLPRGFTPHKLRHTWASWHWAVHKDLLKLKVEGGWSSVGLVEVYAHLLPSGHEAAIKLFWEGERDTSVTRPLIGTI